MARFTNPFIVHVGLAIVCLSIVLLLLPPDTVLWRRAFAVILSIGLGYHLATALLSSGSSKATRTRMLFEGLAFPLLIVAFQLIPETIGWILLAAGFFWRLLVSRLLPSA